MNTWLMLLLVVAIAAVGIFGLAYLGSLAITRSAKRYLQKQKQRDTQWILGVLPGKNCKDCGLESCEAYAQQTAENRGFCSQCPWMDTEAKEQIEAEFAQRQADLQSRIDQSKKKEF